LSGDHFSLLKFSDKLFGRFVVFLFVVFVIFIFVKGLDRGDRFVNVLLVLFEGFDVFLFGVGDLSDGVSLFEHVHFGSGLGYFALVGVSFPQGTRVFVGDSDGATQFFPFPFPFPFILEAISSCWSGLQTECVLIKFFLNEPDLFLLSGDDRLEFLIQAELFPVEPFILVTLFIELDDLSAWEVLVVPL
jgi:hypothetical protein